ncbi:MAG: hypothetical protein ACI8RD_002440, partial [Bacillariaceae sp.]|jgi:hypothetical protein
VQLQHTDRHFRIEKKWTAERDIGVSFFLSPEAADGGFLICSDVSFLKKIRPIASTI